uniref:PXT107.7 n=1 Tax=Nocardia sp. 107 TaxID=373212 RepID=Q27I88_9NOCA|nr:pXT107.7 [Nocardia sp. 107]
MNSAYRTSGTSARHGNGHSSSWSSTRRTATSRQIKPDGGDAALKKSNALAAENAWLTEDVVKKCGSVGIYFVIATQKPTTDAIPSAIRDNLTDGVCLGVRTEAVAVAALGESIKNHPEASPLQFMKHKYKGCAVFWPAKKDPDSPGFRNSFCSPRRWQPKSPGRTMHLAAGSGNRTASPSGRHPVKSPRPHRSRSSKRPRTRTSLTPM